VKSQPDSAALPSAPAQTANGAARDWGVRGRFRRGSRLLKHADFDRVYKRGKRQFSANLTVFYLGNENGSQRVGFTVGKVLGGAVQRNRIKRRLREAVRGCLKQLSAPVDVVINPKKSVLTLEFGILRKEVAQALGAVQQKMSRGKA